MQLMMMILSASLLPLFFDSPCLATGQAQPELIPRRAFTDAAITDYDLSPDGGRFLYSRQMGGDDLELCIRDQETGSVKRFSGLAVGLRGSCSFYWAGDSRRILVLSDAGGRENPALFVFYPDRPGSRAKKFLSQKKVQVRLLPVSAERPDEVLLLQNRENPAIFDVYRADLRTGKVSLLMKNPGSTHSFLADARLEIRSMTCLREDGGREILLREGPDRPWKTAYVSGVDETVTVDALSRDGRYAYVLHNLRTDKLALYRRDLQTGEESLLCDPKVADIRRVMYSASADRPVAVAIDHLKPVLVVLERSFQTDFEALGKLGEGRIAILNRSLDQSRWIFLFSTDRHPVSFCTLDRGTGKTGALFSSRPGWDPAKASPRKAVVIRSRDGLDLVSYLTLPAGLEPRRLPTVLVVHGGPWGERHEWGFNTVAQWLANRGYAVLEVNFRGSDGFGKRFQAAANRQWGRKIQEDLLDGLQWAVDEGITDPKRIAAFGGSYGGYATLALAAFHPARLTCAVDVCGPSDLAAFIRAVPPYWKPLLQAFFVRVGNPDTDGEALREVSPLYHAEGISVPLLIAHGRNDPRVDVRESRRIVEMLRQRKREVTYLEFADEGHDLAVPNNRLAFFAETEAFLARHLGGRCEPPTPQEQEILDSVRQAP